MTTKLVIFDLDGVLIDSKDYHYEALNQALGEEYAISREAFMMVSPLKQNWNC
jgi:beta-phosphoglucomutase-like phosphatase (HAD superfamily)